MIAIYLYRVTYTTARMPVAHIEVEAIDAIDAKHLAEAAEGEVIIKATARKIRRINLEDR